VVPLALQDGRLSVAMANPFDGFALQAMALLTGQPVECRIGLASEIHTVLDRLYRGAGGSGIEFSGELAGEGEGEVEVARLRDLAAEAPVVSLVNRILQRGVREAASDIHIEPCEDGVRLRYRIDGMLREAESPPWSLYAAMVSRLKILAGLDIAERRLPQDGRIQMELDGRAIDLRVSSVPTLHGESLVLRLLYRDSDLLEYAALGLDRPVLDRLQQALERPWGIVLATGPTGCGKTTTLYTALKGLNASTRKILTVEDPIEYALRGVNQIQVKPQIGLSFARTLRALVRQDPDVIMVGEMRDAETAEIAVQSALTGHLVLSTLHTNDAASGLTRLLDLGVAGFLVNSVVNGILAQRLVRRLCPVCRAPYPATSELIDAHGLQVVGIAPGSPLYRPVGCPACRESGYRGREAIAEMLLMSEAIRHQVLARADVHEIAAQATAEGMRSMYEDGLGKVQAGQTSLEEVLRVTREA